jgi:LmbE family N-acetylglucosaminyl deacetylase
MTELSAEPVLVIAAHPDDEVLGAGGTIARFAEAGAEMHIAILGEGVTSRYAQPAQASQALLDELHAASDQVGELLGAVEVHAYTLPDNRFDSVAIIEVIKIVEDLLGRIDPTIVYTHHSGDLNIDHAVVHRAVLTATRPGTCRVRELYAFEIPSSTEWGFGQLEPRFNPNTFVDISATLERKLEAMALYQGEARAFPHPRSADALRALASHRGSQAGLKAAEAFQLIRRIG